MIYDRRKSLWDTTNAIESVDMSLRKLTKNRGAFPSDEAWVKLFCLALRNISRKWTMPIRDWKGALDRFTIQFEERLPQRQLKSRLHMILHTLDVGSCIVSGLREYILRAKRPSPQASSRAESAPAGTLHGFATSDTRPSA